MAGDSCSCGCWTLIRAGPPLTSAAPTRWRWGYGQWDVPDGEAVLLSTAVGIDLGVLMDRVGLVGKVKCKLRLLSPAEREAAGKGSLEKVVAARGGEMWPVTQAMVELLARDNAERQPLGGDAPAGGKDRI